MKKIISFLLIISIFSITFVYAERINRIYISSDDNKLYYDSNEFDENIFLHYLNLIPGDVYKDELLIENNTDYSYDLYLKVIEKEQNKLSNELLDNILMKIYLDGKLIYDGGIKGKDYLGNGIDLQKSVFLGNYTKGSSSKLEVVTMLDSSYSNTENCELASIDWEFYTVTDDEIKILNPKTSDFVLDFIILAIISILVIIGILLISYKYRKSHREEK